MARMPKLQQHPKTRVWRVRVRVPDSCRAQIGKSEILRSLNTKDRKEAERLALPVLQQIEAMFERARAGEPVEWSQGKIVGWSADYYEVLVSHFLMDRAAEFEQWDSLGGLPPGFDLSKSVERFLRERNITVPRSSETFKTLLKEIRIELPPEGASPKHPIRGHAQSAPQSKSEGEPGLPISQLLDRYLAEKEPSPQTTQEWKTVVRRFSDFLGSDVDVRSLTVTQVRDFKDALAKLPKKLKAAERERPFATINDQSDERDRISIETVRKHIACLIAIFRWGVSNKHLDANPALDLKPKATRRKEKRLPFEWGELNRILQSPVYTGCASPMRRSVRGDQVIKDAIYWIPLVLLFSGARLEEVGQANLEDVRCEEGVHFLSVRDLADDQQVKTDESRRRIPLHPHLLALGFLEHVHSLRERGEQKLFPDLRLSVWRGRTKWTAGVSKAINKYLDAIGLSDPRKVVHSFRHVMKSAMDESDIADKYQNAILGHAGNRGGRWYGKGIPLKHLAAAMERVSFPELDIEHLKQRAVRK